MFTLQRPENPLAKLASSAATGVQQGMQMGREARELDKLSGLNEESSPLDWFQAINSLRVSDDKKQQLYDVQAKIEKSKTERMKADQKIKQDVSDLEKEDKRVGTIRRIFGDNAAELYESATEGGKTRLYDTYVDAIARGETDELKETFEALTKPKKDESPQIVDTRLKSELTGEFDYPKLDVYKGLKRSEIPKHKQNLRKENSPIFQDAVNKASSSDRELRSIKILDNIEGTGKLPQGLGKIIINPWTGEPWGAAMLFGLVNPETQQFVKTINDFTTKARDSFPGRVTNFDLQRFMARLPGLLNSAEGRKVILNQMRLSSEIDNLYNNAIKDIYRHYGLHGVTQEEAQELAEIKIANDKEQLEDELFALNEEADKLSERSSEDQNMQVLPNAASNKGRRIVDEDTGMIYESDGSEWRPRRA